jgi:hypothetical protein
LDSQPEKATSENFGSEVIEAGNESFANTDSQEVAIKDSGIEAEETVPEPEEVALEDTASKTAEAVPELEAGEAQEEAGEDQKAGSEPPPEWKILEELQQTAAEDSAGMF